MTQYYDVRSIDNDVLLGATSTATAAGTTTLTVASSQVQVFTGSTTQTVKLPTTSIKAGHRHIIINQSSGAVTAQSSGANTITTLAANSIGVFSATQATPTTASHWVAEVFAFGKVLTANNSLTLAGTDGNTYTFPASSAGGITSSAVAIWDSSGRLNANAFISTQATTATAAGTTAIVSGSSQIQVFTGSTTQTVTLPTSFMLPGMSYVIINQSSGAVTVQSSGANTIATLPGGSMGVFVAQKSAPTAAADWVCTGVVVDGKTLTVNKSLTLDGTDGTTMTFPSTSATIARTDAANAFTGHQTIEGVTSTGATGTGNLVFDTSPTLVTPALGTPASGNLANATNLPLTGLAAAAYNTTPTASTLAEFDANTNLSANALLKSTTSTATAAGTTTLTIASTQVQVFTGSTTQTVKLPTTSVPAGHEITIINQSSGSVTVQSSGANTIVTLATNTGGIFRAQKATPTAATDWNAIAFVQGKALTVNNSITLAGTDGNTYTFPASSVGGITGSCVAIWDSSGRLNAVNFISSQASTATAAGTTVLNASSNQIQVFTGSTTQTVTLGTTFVQAGMSWKIINNSSGVVTVQSSGGNTIGTVASNAMGTFTALVATPTTAANWWQQ